MPRQLQPPSLRKASIENIVCHFDDYWCAGITSHLLEDSDQPVVMTPFQYLRDDMIQEIIDQLHERMALFPHHFQILLHSNIRRLHLKYLRRRIDEDFIKTLGTRCQKLTDFKLSQLGHEVEPGILCSLLINLPQLISLDLHYTRLNNNVIKVISENCPNLIDLNVKGCNLDDEDFLYLCNPETHGETFPKLRKLSFDSRCIDKHTVVRLLKSHSSLRSLGECTLIDNAFDKMYGDEFQSVKEVSPEWIHNLSEISVDGKSGEELKLSEADRLYLTVQCCPFLTELTLVNIKDPESLEHVSKLKHLKTVHIHMMEQDDTHFSLHIAPLLCKIGENLTSLGLIWFKDVSLTQIANLCVNLESLSLYGCNMRPVDGNINQDDPYFTKLNVIHIHYDSSKDTSDVLHELLQNTTKLREMIFYGVDCLTDTIVSDANRKHGFRHLRKCYFHECPSISVESLWALLSPENPLEVLSYCTGDGQGTDSRLLKQEVLDRQFDVKLITFSD